MNVKLPGHRPRLPGKVISFHIVSLNPAYKAVRFWHLKFEIHLTFEFCHLSLKP